MKKSNNDLKDNKDEVRHYQKRNFIARLPFGVKATFIKYWFYGALYFFCFMGLGNYVKNENLVLVTGLIGGVLFDIALYNIFLIFADSREEASKWWIFKNKKFYSIFVNVIVITGLIFAFYYIVVPINQAKPASLVWLFQEPLSSAILLTILDSAFVWLKNLTIILFNKILRRDKNAKVKKEAYIKLLEVTPVSVSFEINNKDACYIKKPYNVLLNDEIIFKKINKNSLTIYDLKPDTRYELAINRENVIFTTPKIYKAYKVYDGHNLQKVINDADQYSLIVVNEGTYAIKSLSFKNNIVLYLRKGATVIASANEEDYPIIPAYSRGEEVYGNYHGEPMQMRQSIIHIDHLKNVTIVGEGTIDGQAQLCDSYKKTNFKIAPPHLIFINHSSNISIIGITLKNSPQSYIHPFFSYNIKLVNLNINHPVDSIIADGITPECSSDVCIAGTHFINLDNCVAIKSGQKTIAETSHVSSRNITITNCVMENAASAVTFGNECSSGINSIAVSRCCFNNLNFGIKVETKRGNGQNAIIKDVNVSNIKMDNVLTPIVMNMFSSNNLTNHNNRILTKERIPIDENTPFFDNFLFKNIEAKNFEYAAGYFYGLPEKYIYEIKIVDSVFIAKDICNEGTVIKTDDTSKCSKKGFIAKNVRSINLKNVKLEKITGNRVEIENVSEVSDCQ